MSTGHKPKNNPTQPAFGTSLQDSWNDEYPPYGDRPGPNVWPPWNRLPLTDLADYLSVSHIPLDEVTSILDLGSGDGRRIIYALARNGVLNRPQVHVTCVDFSVRATVWGVDLWKRLREGVRPADYPLPPSVRPVWSMEFRNEDATALPPDIQNRKYDIVIDWMMLHGMAPLHVEAHVSSLMRLFPRYIVLNCFSKEGATIAQLDEAVSKVEKRQWNQSEVERLFSDSYELFAAVRQWPEDRTVDDGDGCRAAKRSYCFRRKS